MESDLLAQGVELMIVGMGTVFVFLSLLVLAMNLMSALAARLEPAVAPDAPSADEVAAISAAIARHRNQH